MSKLENSDGNDKFLKSRRAGQSRVVPPATAGKGKFCHWAGWGGPWTLTMWKYSFVASNCPDHHPAGAGVAVTFSWQLLACSWYLHILRCPDTGTGLDLAGWSPPLHTGKRVLDLKVPQYRSHGPFYRSSLFLGLYATQFLVLDLCHFNMLGLCFPTANQINWLADQE